jgi:hypothetical protein
MCVETREARDDRAHRAIIAQTVADRLVANPVHP